MYVHCSIGGGHNKKLVAHGNSAALIIDKPILQLIKVDENNPLEITTSCKNLIISPVESEKQVKVQRHLGKSK